MIWTFIQDSSIEQWINSTIKGVTMSVFTNKTITNAGMNLIAQGMAGGSITFKNILLGSGTFTGQDLANQTALVKVENTLPITGVNRNGSTVSLTTTLTPQQIQSDYAWSELGVIAEGETGGEILYLYGHTTQTSIISRSGLDEKIIQVTLLVSNVQNVTATIDNSLVYLTQAELDNHNEGEDSHADIRQELARLNEQMAAIDISWDSINGKPSTFPPSPHNHSMDDVSYGNSLWASVDLNTYTQTGAWYISSDSGHTNAPSGFKYFTLVVEKYGNSDGSYIRQTVQDAVNHTQYTRTWRGANNGWGAWKSVDADTLDGKHASDFPLKSQGIGGNAPIWNGSNLNDIPIGTYTTLSSGVPVNGEYFLVTTIYNDTGKIKEQYALRQGNGERYFRFYNSTSWSAWKNLDDYAPSHKSANGYWGICPVKGNDTGWIRTPSLGLLPYASGGNNGSLGTSSWKFKEIHGVNIFANGVNLGTEVANLKSSMSGKMYMPQGSAKITFSNPPSRKGDIYLGKMTCKYGGYIAVRATFLDKVSHVTGHVKVRTLRATGSNSESTFDTATLTAFNIAPGATLDYTVGASSYKNVAYTTADNVSTTETYVIKVEAGQILQFGAFGINTGESVITNIQIIYEEVAL